MLSIIFLSYNLPNLMFKIHNNNYLKNIFQFMIVLTAIHILFNYQNFYDYIFGDRELIRARDLLSNFQFYGAETLDGQGNRVFGGFINYYLFLLISLFRDIDLIFLFNQIFIFCSLFFFYYSSSKFLNKLTSLIAIILIITSDQYNNLILRIWNPSFGFGFYLIGLSFYLIYIKNKKKIFLIFSLAFVLLSAQMHYTYLSILILIIFENLYFRRENIKSLFSILFAVFFLVYLPVLINEFFDLRKDFQENLIDYYKTTNNIQFSLKQFLSLFYRAISFVQVSDKVLFYIPFTLLIVVAWSFYISVIENKTKEILNLKY